MLAAAALDAMEKLICRSSITTWTPQSPRQNVRRKSARKPSPSGTLDTKSVLSKAKVLAAELSAKRIRQRWDCARRGLVSRTRLVAATDRRPADRAGRRPPVRGAENVGTIDGRVAAVMDAGRC